MDSWDDYFFNMAKLISTRSTCLRRQYGSVLVIERHVVSSGYNGSPRGCVHCSDVGCRRVGIASGQHPELCRAVHAEQNCITNAARFGVCIRGSSLYIWLGDMPCPTCAKLLINAGVLEIHYTQTGYPGANMSIEFFNDAGVRMVKH